MGQIKKKSEKRVKKEDYWRKLWALTDEYKKALMVDVDNVSSQQLNQIRRKLRPLGAKMLMGKNTLMKSALAHKMAEPVETDEDYSERKDSWKKCDELDAIVKLLRGNTGVIFTNGDLSEVKKVLDQEAREAPAKVGAIAPDDVWIRAGSTGLDPKQTSFFQQLNIQTKILKTQIEIVADKKVITAGLKIEATQAALLDKLKIRPFSYKMHVKKVYDDGQVFGPEILDITSADILKRFQTSITNMASISLASGYVTKPAIPHIIANSFKNLVAVTFDSDYSFKEADKLKEAAKNAVHVVAAPAGGAAPAKAAPAKVEEKPKEEEADVDMGGLFGDDY
jgi:large subunit ribosomal protein LP0